MRKSTKSFLVDTNVWLALVYDLHVHHQPARHWFESLAANQAFFCRFTQLGLLRLLTNSKVMAKDAMTQRAAWGIYDRTMIDERVNFTTEPPAVETELRRLTQSSSGSTRVWSDAYLARGGIHLLGPYATCCGRTSHSLPRADGTARDRLVRRSEAGGRTAVHAPVNAGD